MFFLLSKQEGTRAEGREMLPLLSFQSDLQATLTSQASPSYFSELWGCQSGVRKESRKWVFFSLVLMFADLRLIGIYELHLFPNCEALAGLINFTASGTCWTITHQALCKALCFAWVFPFDLPASQWGRSFTCPHFTDEGWDIKRGSGVVKLCSYNMTKLLIQIFLNRTFWRPQRDLSFLERMVGWGIFTH